MTASNLNQAILATMKTYADHPCFKVGHNDLLYRVISYHRFQGMVLRLMYFMRENGLSTGGKVALVAKNSLEWMVTYMATLLAGGVVVVVKPDFSEREVRLILHSTDAHIVLLDNPDTYSPLPDTVQIVLSTERCEQTSLPVRLLDDILSAQYFIPNELIPALWQRAEVLPPDALATIHYITDDKDNPVGMMFDHGQILESLACIAGWYTLTEDDTAFTVLPWTHFESLIVSLYYFFAGVTNILAQHASSLMEALRQTSPSVMLNFPPFYEQLYDKFTQSIARMPPSSRDVFYWALSKGQEYYQAGDAASEALRQEHARADLTFFSRLRGHIGGRIRRFYVAGATLQQHHVDFFQAIGMPILRVYGLSQAGGFPAVCNGVLSSRAMGEVVPGYEVQTNPDGEILVRGATITRGYWGQTQPVTDEAGWFHTGDLGYMDELGRLYLTGRRQAAIVLSNGHTVDPSLIEAVLVESSPIVEYALVVGDGRPYVAAFIIPDLDALNEHFDSSATSQQSSDLRWIWPYQFDDVSPIVSMAHPILKTLFDEVINAVNATLPTVEHIKAYSLLDQAGGEAATHIIDAMPAGRHLIAKQYARHIEALYPVPPRIASHDVTEVHVSPERMRDLLEKENILDAWMSDAGIEFLFELARAKKIDVSSMVNICDTAAMIAQTESEERPLSTAIIVGDPAHIERVLPPSQVQLLRHGHIRQMRGLMTSLATIVDGETLGYVVDKHGYLRGVHKLNIPVASHAESYLLGPRFQQHAALSRMCHGLVFFVPTGGKQVRVFANGQLVGAYSNGDWAPESVPKINEVVKKLAQTDGYQLDVIRRILRCAFQMSEQNRGAIFSIGNADHVLELSDAPSISHFALMLETSLDSLSDRELINFAKQDGATVIDAGGILRGCMVFMRPSATTEAEIGPGKGARHSSAAKMSAETQCLTVVVSQDGPITLYSKGRRVLSL